MKMDILNCLLLSAFIAIAIAIIYISATTGEMSLSQGIFGWMCACIYAANNLLVIIANRGKK